MEIHIKNKPKKGNVLDFDDYELYKFYEGEKIKVWPLWEKEYEAKRFSPLTGELLYTNRIKAREATYESIWEHVYRKIGDLNAVVEVLNRSGLSDAVLYRVKFSELSTGQKEGAKIASLLTGKPNLLLIDEFAAHLDILTAMRVAKKVSEILRKAGVTALIITHRSEVVKALDPDKVLFVGYGSAKLTDQF